MVAFAREKSEGGIKKCSVAALGQQKAAVLGVTAACVG
jgi:hypothetical protein